MKFVRCFFFVLILQSSSVFCQVNQPNMYFFDEFKNGFVYYSDGEMSKGVFNYNYILSEMQFFQDNKILNLKYLNSIVYVRIDTVTFVPLFNERSYAELLIDGPVVLLHEKKLKPDRGIDDGTYGVSQAVASVDKFSSIDPSNGLSPQITRLKTVDDLLMNHRFFLMKNQKPMIASKRAFNKYFPEKKEQIKQYLSDHPSFSFKEKRDLINLFLFLQN